MMIAALAGGIGASKLLLGMQRVMDPRELAIIVNTGDDVAMHGLCISPDLDIVTYTLAGIVNSETGWGICDDTFHSLGQLAVYGRPRWFNLGDRDLATHIHRTALMRDGASLSSAAQSIRESLGVAATILPMSDQPVRTMLETDSGRLDFQEYMVEHRAEPVIREIYFDGAERARPAPGVIETIAHARGIVICPSNPLISIGPILSVHGVRKALQKRRRDVVAVSPIVGGKSLKGPSDLMMAQLGFDVSATGVARMYQDVCGAFLIDSADASQRTAIESLDMKVVVSSAIMRSMEDKERLAREVLQFFGVRRAEAGA